MSNHILYCPKCKEYTMKESCSCGEKAISVKPAKFNLEDKFGHWRRLYKKEHKIQ